jgi:hypothetical protein
MLSGKMTMAWTRLRWRVSLRVMTLRRSPKTMRMGPMMSDLLGKGVASLFSLFGVSMPKGEK